MSYVCKCGKIFYDPQKFNGHKANCETHLLAAGKEHWVGENRKNHLHEKMIEKYGSMTNYSQHLSNCIKEGNKNRTDTVEYYVNHINKEEFIREYIEENRPRTYMREKYKISDYMMDQLVKAFDCKKDKKHSSKLGWATKCATYPADNLNNWQKGHETREKNSGSVEASYKQGLQHQQETMLKRYGTACPLNLEFLANHRNKRDSRPNQIFANMLERNNIKFEREYCIGLKSFDFKVENILIEVNPTPTHNTYFIPYGDYKGLDPTYHCNKSCLAEERGFRCVHIWDWDDIDKVIQTFKHRPRVYARKCDIQEISKDDASKFLNKNHLQGYARDSIRLGLYYNGALISVMTFGKPRYNKNYEYELIRYCSIYEVVGGAEKLFKKFILLYDPNSIISYCDKSKFEGKVYTKLGFTYVNTSLGKHWYNIKSGKHITDNLLRQRGFDQLLGDTYGCFGKGTSNEQLMLDHDFLPVIDAGQATYSWTKHI